MPKFSEISPNQLMRLIGTPDAPQIVDVCIDADFEDDPYVIRCSRRVSFQAAMDPATLWENRPVVVVCQKVKKLSHGVAAYLRYQGMRAETLEGGMYGWRDASLPRIPASAIPQVQHGSTLWVTRHGAKIDRIACPWLIRCFVDPKARFLYAPPSDVMDVASKFGATPFDVENVAFTHRSDGCTFDAMLEDFDLKTPALSAMADVIRAADTDRLVSAPQAAGLLAQSIGFSRQYSEDAAQLKAALPLYDALYSWTRDGQAETHASDFGKGDI